MARYKDEASRKQRFIETLAQKLTVGAAAEAAGISYRTSFNWRNTDPAFAEAWDEAQEVAIERLETRVYEQAMQDEQPLRQFFVLKRFRPEYRDNYRIEITGGLELLAAPELLRRLEAREAEIIDVEPVAALEDSDAP